MKWFAAAALVAVAGVVAEIILPGRWVYHAGWYNVGLCALLVVTIAGARRAVARANTLRSRLAVVAVAIGATAAGLAGVASGLFAPDDRSVVGAPGERVRVEELGVLDFPLAAQERAQPRSVILERPLHPDTEIGSRPRYAGSFILRASPRDVVYVQARDLRGNNLTVTQPDGSVFLSPVLLMEQRQTIAGLNVPFDSFNVPAARRIVKTILFSPAQAAVLLHGAVAPGQSAVIFAVDDENDRPIPHALAAAGAGRTVRVGGLFLRAGVVTYPAVEVISAPNIVAVSIGVLLVVGGLIALLS